MLLDEVKKSRGLRKLLLIPILIIGLFGLLIPVLPGLLFIYLFLMLVNPDIAEIIKNKTKDFFIAVLRI